MRQVPKRVLIQALVLIFGHSSTGCQGGSGSAVVLNREPTAIEVAVDRGIDAACGQLLACTAEWGPVVPDLASCRSLAGLLFALDHDPRRAEVTALDDEAFDACIDAATAGCPRFDAAAIVRCLDSSLVGLVPLGSCCDDRDGCLPGLVCARGESAAGVCWPRAGLGEDCERAVCDPGSVCDSTQHCAPLPGVGATCSSETGCVATAHCSYATLLCEPLPAEGEACLPDSRCAPTFRCDLATWLCVELGPGECDWRNPCAADGRCDELRGVCVYPAALGDSCYEDLDCPPGAECVSEGTERRCHARALEGELCGSGTYLPGCALYFGLECVDGSCVSYPELDHSCEHEHGCRPYASAYCNGTSLTCEPRLEVGEPCSAETASFDDMCVIGAYCDAELGVCVPAARYESERWLCPSW